MLIAMHFNAKLISAEKQQGYGNTVGSFMIVKAKTLNIYCLGEKLV